MLSTSLGSDRELEAKTQRYWKISKSYSGQSDELIPFSSALRSLSKVASKTNPARPLAHLVRELKQDIIYGWQEETHPGATVHALWVDEERVL